MADVVDGTIDGAASRSLEEGGMSTRERIRIAGEIGKWINDGQHPHVPTIVRVVVCPPTERKQRDGEEWGRVVIDTPDKAWKAIIPHEDVKHIPIVMRETESVEPTLEQLRRMMMAEEKWAKHVADLETNEAARVGFAGIYRERADKCRLGEFAAFTDLETLRRGIVHEIYEDLAGFVECPKDQLRPMVANAVKRLLGVPDNESASNGSKWDIPQAHHLMKDEGIRRQIKSVVTAKLIRDGYCSSLATSLRATHGRGDAI
jgi:hypothetical protein